MIYLLDTNAWSKYMGPRPSPVKQRVESCGPYNIRLCSIVKCEMLFGALRSPIPDANLALVADMFARFESLPFDDAAARHAARVRAHLAGIGLPIGPNDLLIAAIALANALTVVTHNTREFARVPGLNVEDWQISPAG